MAYMTTNKVKLEVVPVLNQAPRHKDALWSGGIAPRILDIGNWKDVSSQPHAPAVLPPGKEPPVPIGQETGSAPEPIWTR
jgi:hypothetical protein